MDHVYKSMLQSHAHKQNLNYPVYATERQGYPHTSQFLSKVTFVGETYESKKFYPTIKESEQAAAKIALDSIVLPQSPEASVGVVYKNLLQEFAQREKLLFPVYTTATSGPSHWPTFTSTVEFNGEVFYGEEAKTKKLAEMSAAKVAYEYHQKSPPQVTPTSLANVLGDQPQVTGRTGSGGEGSEERQARKQMNPWIVKGIKRMLLMRRKQRGRGRPNKTQEV